VDYFGESKAEIFLPFLGEVQELNGVEPLAAPLIRTPISKGAVFWYEPIAQVPML